MIPSSILRQIILLLLLPSAGFAVDVTLEWDPNPETDIIGYRIYYVRLRGGSLEQIETGKQTRAVLSGLPAGKNWMAAITARNASGLESGFSNAVFFDSGPVPKVPAAKAQLILPMSDGPSSIPSPTVEPGTDDGKRLDSGLVGSSNHQQVYQFEAPTAADWQIWCQVSGTEPMASPWLLSLNGQPPLRSLPGSPAEGEPGVQTGFPAWTRLQDPDGAPLTLFMNEGLQTLVLDYGESGFPPDRILITSDPAFIPPPEVPAGNNFLTVSSPPQSQSLFTGDMTVLEVTTAATGPVSWQWLHNGNSIPDAVFPTLTIGPASSAEAGIYQVRIIMDETEILTEPAVISVWPRPTLTLSPSPNRLNPEENGLEVLVSGGSLQPLSLEFSENLTDWSLLEAFQLDDQGTRTIPDQTKTARQRFYRLRAGE